MIFPEALMNRPERHRVPMLLLARVLPAVLVAALLGSGGVSDCLAEGNASMLRLANGEWPPFTGRDLPAGGCDSQVVSEVFAREGIQVQYEFLPWARGLLLSLSGMLDGAVEWDDTPEHRKSHFVSQETLSQQQWVFMHRKATKVSWERLDDLHPYVIGLTIGYAYSDVFVDLRRQRPTMFHEAASDLLNLKKLLTGRIDLFPIVGPVGQYLIKKELRAEDQAELTLQTKPLAMFTPHLLLSRAVPENERRMQLFEQGLQRLKASDRYREIMAPCEATPF
jgi:polar amino acid transport system substrate-binding protein